MSDEMVMRSVYLRHAEDAQLRQLAHELAVTKSDLIRSAISLKLEEWRQVNDRDRILDEIERRDPAAQRAAKQARRENVKSVAVVEVRPAGQPSRIPPSKAAAPRGARARQDALV